MSHISLPTLAERVNLSRRHLQRLAVAGQIPGASRTAGGHWRVKKGVVLDGWISGMAMNGELRRSVGRSRGRAVMNSIINCEAKIEAYFWDATDGNLIEVGFLLDRLAKLAKLRSSQVESCIKKGIQASQRRE